MQMRRLPVLDLRYFDRASLDLGLSGGSFLKSLGSTGATGTIVAGPEGHGQRHPDDDQESESESE